MQLIHFMAIVGMHQHNTPDTFFLAFDRIIDRIAFFQGAGIDTNKGQLADVRVSHQFKRQRRERFVVARMAFRRLPFLINAVNRRHILRRRHQFDNRIQHPLYAFIFKGATAQHRLNFAANGTFTQPGHNIGLAQLAALEIFIHQLIVSFRRCGDHFLSPLPGGCQQLVRYRRIAESHPLGCVIP